MFRLKLKTALLASALMAIGAGDIALAQIGPAFDPAQLPAVKGKVVQYIPTPRGDVDGLLLDDGTVVRLPPPEARKLGDALAVGKDIVVRGEGYAGPLGKAVGAREIGPDAAHLVKIAGPRPGWGAWMHEHWGHEHGGPGHEGMGHEGMMHGPDGKDAGAPPPPPPQ